MEDQTLREERGRGGVKRGEDMEDRAPGGGEEGGRE